MNPLSCELNITHFDFFLEKCPGAKSIENINVIFNDAKLDQ